MADRKAIKENAAEYANKIKAVEQSLEKLKQFLSLGGPIRKKLADDAKDYLIDIAKEYKLKSICDIQMPFNKNHLNKGVVFDAYKLKMYSNIKEDAVEYEKQFDDIRSDLENAPLAFKNAFSWLFTSSEKKKNAIDSVNRIDEFYACGIIEKAGRLTSFFDSLKKEDSLKDFFEHEEEYVVLINETAKTGFYAEEDPQKPNARRLNKLKKDYSVVLDELEKLNADSEKIPNEMEALASDLVNEEVLKVLDGVNIDEIGKRVKGIRLSALKNEGIKTVSDVLKKGSYELSDIYGISDMNAYEIGKVADELFDSTKTTIKLKLNADDKNTQNTQLLKDLFIYLDGKDRFNEAHKVYKEKRSKISSSLKSIPEGYKDLDWYFLSQKKKDRIINAYTFLEESNKEEFIKIFRKLAKAVEKKLSKDLDDAEVWDVFQKDPSRYISELDELLPGYFGNGDVFYGLPEPLAENIQKEIIRPEGLKVKLRRYQEWGVKYILHQKKVLLGDEMGLGKTIQAIATMVSLSNTGESFFLVVCPASVIINWCREIEKHSTFKAIKIHGRERQKMFDLFLRVGGVGVTTYETTGLLQMPEKYRLSMLVVDEAHYVKNPDAKRTDNVIRIGNHAERILYMTGTALENRVEEMIELVDQLNPGVARDISDFSFMSTSDIFRQKVSSVYYRRKREDVLTELPELIETEEWCTLGPKEKDEYEWAVLNKDLNRSRRVSWNIGNLKYSSKAARLNEIVDMAKEDGRKIIIFSYYRDTINKIHKYFNKTSLTPITGSISVKKRQEIIDEFDDSPAGTILISQIQAGGTGLNIQSASVVIIAEPQLKPSIESQAISRAYRMGQTRNVFVHRLLCENTVDERFMALLDEKQSIFDAFADESVAAKQNFEIDKKTAGKIIDEEIERICKEKGIDPREYKRKKLDIKPEEE